MAVTADRGAMTTEARRREAARGVSKWQEGTGRHRKGSLTEAGIGASVVTGALLWYNAVCLAGKSEIVVMAIMSGGSHCLSRRTSQRGSWGAFWTA